MAPATNLGAATPVSIGGGNDVASGRSDDGTGEKPPRKGPDPEVAPSESPMERKILNDAVAYIRGLAELRGRNADWAERLFAAPPASRPARR